MCGISGIIGHITPTDIPKCAKMNDRLRHRGPDDAGIWNWNIGGDFGAILNHRRLSIIDLRHIAAEPMISEATGTALVFNGEIYNFRSLRKELQQAGARFVTSGDTEVILHGYDLWGPEVVTRLRGMFAFMLVDPNKRRAIVARDGYGIKPLYWSRVQSVEGGPAFAFASEGRALVEAGFAARRTDPERIGNFLWNGFVSGPQTIWTDVEEVPRGSFAVIDQQTERPQFQRFWNVGSSLKRPGAISLEEADSIIAETVKLHLVADVPKVVFLSGGVDSTAVAAAAARYEGDLHTLSVAFDDAAADERHYAAAAAEAIGSRHHVVELSAEGILLELDSAVDALDQPSFDGVNSWFVSREAARLGFKVALSGAGGDELTGGYTSFARALRAQPFMRLPGIRAGGSLAGRIVERTRPWSKSGQLGRSFGALERMYQTQYALFSTGLLRRLLADPSASPRWGLSNARESDLRSEISALSTLRAVTALESEMFLGDRLLRDMDSVSMAHSIEVRVPLVDTGLSDSLSGLTDEDRYLPIGKKLLLRRQSTRALPESFFARPKRGFEFPMDVWMRGALRELISSQLLDAEQCSALGLQPAAVAEVWKRFLSRAGAVYWTRPWAVFALMRWASTNGVRCQ